jgi:hypothetical protein
MLTAIERAWRHWQIDRTVRRCGFAVQYVGDYDSAPTWAYTIGFLETLGQPEVIAFDLRQADVHWVFWTLFGRLKDGSLTLADGEVLSVEAGEVGVLRRLHPTRLFDDDFWLGMAGQRHIRRTGGPDGFDAFQLVLHDPAGNYPWDEGYDTRLLERQPPLWLAQEEPSRLAADAAV